MYYTKEIFWSLILPAWCSLSPSTVTQSVPGWGLLNPIFAVPLFSPILVIIMNSLAPGRSECDSKNATFNLVLLIGILRSSHGNALRWMPQDLTDDKSTLVQIRAWLSSLSPYGVARPQWVTPARYQCDFKNRIGTFTNSNIFFMEELTMGTLVTPTLGDEVWVAFVGSKIRTMAYLHRCRSVHDSMTCCSPVYSEYCNSWWRHQMKTFSS